MKRSQKQKQNPSGPKGKSKYALKLQRRRKLANSLGSGDAPLPILNLPQAEVDAIALGVMQRDRFYANVPAEPTQEEEE